MPIWVISRAISVLTALWFLIDLLLISHCLLRLKLSQKIRNILYFTCFSSKSIGNLLGWLREILVSTNFRPFWHNLLSDFKVVLLLTSICHLAIRCLALNLQATWRILEGHWLSLCIPHVIHICHCVLLYSLLCFIWQLLKEKLLQLSFQWFT